MTRRGLGGLAAATAVLALFTTPAHADLYTGGGAAAGTLDCATGTFVLDAPAFTADGSAGLLHIAGSTSCAGFSILADYGFGRSDVTGPGITCEDVSTGWTWTFGELRMVIGGPCTFAAGGGHSMQFIVEAASAAGVFAGTVVVAPTF